MNRETKFSTLPQRQKFQYLYYCVKVNEGFAITWIKKNIRKESNIEDDYCETIVNALDFLKKILFLEMDTIMDKEIMLNGLADDIMILINELSDLGPMPGRSGALASLKLLDEVYALLINFFFEEVKKDLDNNCFQIILLAALASDLHNTYEVVIPQITNAIVWKDLTDLEIAHPGIKPLLNKFMDEIYLLVHPYSY